MHGANKLFMPLISCPFHLLERLVNKLSISLFTTEYPDKSIAVYDKGRLFVMLRIHEYEGIVENFNSKYLLVELNAWKNTGIFIGEV